MRALLSAFCAAAVLTSTSCTVRADAYGMDQPIAMGPFSFSVISASQGKRWESAEGTVREIHVFLRLHRDDPEPFRHEFASFIGSITIEDAAGNRIPGDVMAVNPTYERGRYRSTQYKARFRYSRSLDGVRNFAAIGTTPSDFVLSIDNPQPERDQPRRVAVQLR